MEPGDPLCCVHEAEAEQKAAAVPYLRLGLDRGEELVCIVDAHAAEAVRPDLRVDGVEVEAWAMRELPGSEPLIDCRSRLDDFLPGARRLALCRYDSRRFAAAILLDLLRTHPHVAFGTDIAQNPHYLPPAESPGDRPAGERRGPAPTGSSGREATDADR